MRKVLVIDDFFENIILIKAILLKALPDVRVFEAISGKSGIQIAREEDPDAILLDIRMPEMDGYEVCEKLKSDSLTKHIPIILISAYDNNTASAVKGLNLGADFFLNKPISPASLVAQIEVVLRIRSVENLLRRERNKYQLITETLPEAVITIGIKNQIIYSSAQASRLFGFEQTGDLLAKNVLELFHPECKKDAEKFIGNVKSYHIVKDVDFRFVKKDLSCFHGELSGSLIMQSQDESLELIFVIRDVTERRQSENRILVYQEKLRSMNSMLTYAEEKERKYIAEALHDGLGQILAIVKIKLTSILHENILPRVSEVIKESSAMIEEAIKETRSLTYDLSPSILYELGLQAAITWKLSQINESYGIRTNFIDKLVDNPLSNDLNILLYRIISELLNNIIKHAKTKTVEIMLSKSQNNIFLSVKDDGIGFRVLKDSPMAYPGFGLFNIHERLQSIQGSMEIDSIMSKGSKITIKIPLSNSKP